MIEIVQAWDGPSIDPTVIARSVSRTIATVPQGWSYRLLRTEFNSPYATEEKRFASAWFRADYLSKNPQSLFLDLDSYPAIDLSTIEFVPGRPYVYFNTQGNCPAFVIYANGCVETMKSLRDSFEKTQFCICPFILANKELFYAFPEGSFVNLSREFRKSTTEHI
jgi:hypothetical protein